MSEESTKRKRVSVEIGKAIKTPIALDGLVLSQFKSASAIDHLTKDMGAAFKAFDHNIVNPLGQTRLMDQVLKATDLSRTLAGISALTQVGDIVKRLQTSFALPKGFTDSISAFNKLDSIFETAIQSTPSLLSDLPQPLIKSTTDELILSRHCLEVFADDPPEPEPISIEEASANHLEAYDQDLWNMYIGAQKAFIAKQTDYKRHILISLRELCTHLLHSLAPKERVTPWILEHSSTTDLLHNGSPTRRARYLYICRDFKNGFIDEFAAQDAKTITTLFNTLNRTHEKDPSFTDKELEILLLRTSHFIEYILTLSQGQ